MTAANRPMTVRRAAELLALGVALTALILAALPSSGDAADNDPTTAPQPDLAAELATDAKALLAELTVTADGATVVTSKVVSGPAPKHVGAPPLMRYDLEQGDGAPVASYRGWYPRWNEVEDGAGGMGTIELASATAVVAFPFDARAHAIQVNDLVQGKDLGTVDVSGAIVDYCADNPSDPDCATDLSVAKADAADPAVAGTQLGYTLTVTNEGPNPAQDVAVVDTLPAGLAFAGGDPRCSASGQTVTCEVGILYAGDSESLSVLADVAADLVHVAGAPTTVTNTATADNRAGDDTDASNDSDAEDTLVVAVADLSVDDVSALAPPVEMVIGEPVLLTVASTLGNAGPSAPMDARVTTTASATSGAGVAPSGTSALEPAVGLGEARVHEQTYELSCTAPGEQTFTFGSAVAPDRPDDTDPNGANDEGGTTVTVDCLVPVALNIHPGSSVNPVNATAKKGSVAAAVLTTEVGEYGLPLAFDATSIDGTTVRFGPRTLIDGGGGANEQHLRAHLEDVVERSDELTRDGDTDAAMHFSTPASGIAPGDTEACARGEFLATDGNTYQFIGCDVVRAF